MTQAPSEVQPTGLPSTFAMPGLTTPTTRSPSKARVTSPYGRYRGGNASAQVIFAACSEFGCGNQTVDLTIGLRR